jgi:protein-tyrosine phosphatase
MVPQIYKVLANGSGFLAVMARPRSGEWLRDELWGLSQLGVATIASLLEPREEAELELTSERALAEELGLNFLSFPIPDRGVPSAAHAFRGFTRRLADDVRAGHGVAVHCRAGIGRSGITAAAVLVSLGHEPRDAFATVSRARGVSVPDTEEQLEWFRKSYGDVSHRV